MTKDVVEVLGLKPETVIVNGETCIKYYDISKNIENYCIYINVDPSKRCQKIVIANKWTEVLIVKIICYNVNLFIKQIKLIEKELDIKLIKED